MQEIRGFRGNNAGWRDVIAMDYRTLRTTWVLPALVALASAAWAQAPQLADLMPQTGLKYSALEGQADTWRVPFDGRDGKNIDVFVTYNDDNKQFALIFATVVDREDKFSFNVEVLTEAMKLSNDYPGMKFVLDEDHGDIDCQSEVYMATITAESLGMYINLVASMSDEHKARLNELAGGTPPAEGMAPATTVPTAATAAADPIQWLSSYPQALAAAAAQHKPLLVDFYGVNCGACQRMDAVTYVDPQVVAQADQFICVKLDVEKHEDLMKQFNVISLPTLVVLSPQGKELRREEGYLDPPGMLKLMGTE